MCGRCGGCLTKCNKGQVHSVQPKRAAVDSMRKGQLDFEVRGNDYASRNVRHDAPDLSRMGTRTNPDANQAEDGIARSSYYGNALHRNAATLVRQMNPLVYLARFYNNVGVTLARSAHNITIGYDARYDGILPLTQQPKIDKPLPY